MTPLFSLLTVQTLLGALDTLWNHEIAERLPGYRRLAIVFGWPPLRALCESLYDHAISPGLAYWARVRHPKET